MTWKDDAYFAPEALIDGKKRQIIWTWLRDDPRDGFVRFGWSGVYGIPRNVWLEDGELKMSPVSEIDALQYDHKTYTPDCGNTVPVLDGEVCRIKGIWNGEGRQGVAVRVSEDGKQRVEIYHSPEEKKLIMDIATCGTDGRYLREEAPFELRAGEKLSLDILIDRSVIEVYANQRQAICRRAYPNDPKNAVGVRLIGSMPEKMDTYRMFPSNPY